MDKQEKQSGSAFKSFALMTVLIVLAVCGTWYIFAMNTVIVKKFEGKRWDLPAKVYAQPLNLYKGATLSHKDLKEFLKLLNYRKASSTQKVGTYIYNKGVYGIHTRGFDFSDGQAKSQTITLQLVNNKITRIDSNHVSDNDIFRLEPVLIGGIYPDNSEDRILVQLKDVPQPLIDALISTEDRSFYQHKGVSIRGTARALVSTLSGGGRQGGSTITQQLIKNFYLNSDRTLKRKVNEAVMALLLELNYSKEEILQAYLNEINLGQNGKQSINGFALAAQFYFNQPLNELSTEKLALLIGLAKGPSYYNPWRHAKRALNRRNTVLNNMAVTGKLKQAEVDALKKQPLGLVAKPMAGKNRFPYFLDVVKKQLKADYNETDLKNDGLRIFTTLNPVLQKTAVNSFNASITSLRKRSKKVRKLQGVILTADPNNGDLLAAVGGYGGFTGYNRITEAKRHVGSLLKPMVFLNALASGKYNLASPVDDSMVEVNFNNKKWSPKNYDKRSHGTVPLYQALAKSYNQATVRLGVEFGLSSFQKRLTQMGINDKLPNYPSIMLGAIEMNPLQVLSLYQVFASNGFKHEINSIHSVVGANGKILQRTELDIEQVIEPKNAYIINYALQKVISSGTAKLATRVGSNLNIAGKTGTTNNYRDAWFAGYTGNLVTVAWVGNDNNSPTGLSGSSGALPVWVNYMKKLTLDPVNLPQPKEVNWLWLGAGSGLLTDQRCDNAVYVPVQVEFNPKSSTMCAEDLYELDNPMPEIVLPDEDLPIEDIFEEPVQSVENTVKKLMDQFIDLF